MTEVNWWQLNTLLAVVIAGVTYLRLLGWRRAWNELMIKSARLKFTLEDENEDLRLKLGVSDFASREADDD